MSARIDYQDWNQDRIEDQEPISSDQVRVYVRYGEKYITPLFVIVECYHHKNCGRGKRAWETEFTKAERKIIAHYYTKLYDWYLRHGLPRQGAEMKPSTYDLLCRAANLFASI